MVMEHIDGSRYDAVLVNIDQSGWWSPQGEGENRTEVDPKSLSLKLEGGETWQAELAFVMVHGTPGEDGLLQAQLEVQGMPCTTADSKAMALTFHKGQAGQAEQGRQGKSRHMLQCPRSTVCCFAFRCYASNRFVCLSLSSIFIYFAYFRFP